jgi:hypothetical protein
MKDEAIGLKTSKFFLKGAECEVVDWIQLAHDRVQ